MNDVILTVVGYRRRFPPDGRGLFVAGLDSKVVVDDSVAFVCYSLPRRGTGFAYQFRRERRWRTTSRRVIAGIELPMKRKSSFCLLSGSVNSSVTNSSILWKVVSDME